jgi:hypothetical protein
MWSYPSNSNVEHPETWNEIFYLQEFKIQMPTTKSYLDLRRSRDGWLLKSLDNRLPCSKSGKSQSSVRELSLHAYIKQVSTTCFGNATLALFTLFVVFSLLSRKYWLRHRNGPTGSPPVSLVLLSSSLCKQICTWSTQTRDPTSVPRHQSENCASTGVINRGFQSRYLMGPKTLRTNLITL